MRAAIFVFLALVLSGCALQPPTPQAIAAAPFDTTEERGVVCTREKPTGSNRVVTVCREVLSALEQEQTQRAMRRLQRQSEGR